MILADLTLIENNQQVDISIKGSKISKVFEEKAVIESELRLTFTDAIVFPGLINAHDHLDFNLFPQFGDIFHKNYTEWGKYIHDHYPDQIEEVLKVPKILRERWGIYKNLICGVTTVINHGPKLSLDEKLINVIESTQSLHSVGFEKWWKIKLNNPFKTNTPVFIHVGEGIDELSKKEIDTLIKWNLIERKLIAIHGVAMDINQMEAFKALVWCPQSNYFLLNATANVNFLKQIKPILFGTDSTLTSNWNIWNHIDFARSLNKLTDEELYQTLNNNPAKLLKLPTGKLEKGCAADLVIAKKKGNPDALDAFLKTQPDDLLLVMCNGKILLFDEGLISQLGELYTNDFQKIKVNDSIKYVFGDFHNLIVQIKLYTPEVKLPYEITSYS